MKLKLFSIIFFLMFMQIGAILALPNSPKAKAANDAPASQSYVKIFYYRENETARASLFAHPESIDILAPQSYSIDGEGNLSGEIAQEVLDFAVQKGIKVMPLVVNKSFGQMSLNIILNDLTKQDAVMIELVKEAKLKGYYGFQIDFEQMNISYKDKFSAFIKKFHDAMSENGLIASVAVISKISDIPSDYKNELWNNLIGVYDYAFLGANTDFVSIMSYDDPGSKGPIARDAWLKKVIAYSMLHIPKEKISLGVALYYWVWDNSREKIVGIGGYKHMAELMKKRKMTYGYSPLDKVPYLSYFLNNKHHTMWYENGRSLSEKISTIKKLGLHGFSAWALGQEVPSIHSSLKIERTKSLSLSN